MSKTIRVSSLLRAKAYLQDEVTSYEVAKRVVGALNETQSEAHDALKTALVCVNHALDEIRWEVE